MSKQGKKKIISLILTLSIITMLILSGPVSAVQVKITNISDTTPNESTDMTFLVQVDIESGERIPVQNLTLTLTNTGGLDNYTCIFNPAGTNITACTGITITKLNSVGYSNSSSLWGYGYGYDYANGVTNYSNTSFSSTGSETWNGYGYGYGYGYTSGYAYNSANYAELAYNITWTTPSVTSNTAYTADFEALVSDGTTKRTYKTTSSSTITVQNVAATTNTGGSGSSGGSASPSTETDSSLPSASDLGAPKGFTTVSKEGDSQAKLQTSLIGILDEAIAKTRGEAKAALEKLKRYIEEGLSESISVTANLAVYKVSNPTTGESVYRSVITLSYTAEEDQDLVEIIEVIPKDVAATAADLVFPDLQPVILQSDPIIQWTFTDVKKGDELKTSYVVKDQLTEITSKTYAAATEEVSTTAPTETPEEIEEEPQDKDIITKAQSLAWIWWTLGIIVVIAMIVVISKKKK